MFDTVKRSKFFMFFVVVALLSAVVFTGGCNGSSSSSKDSGLKLAYDQDNDGVIDIFDDYPNDASKKLYPEISGFETLVGVDGENKAVALPCHYNGTFETSKDVSGETAKFFLFKAEKGKRVAVVFSSPNCRLEDAFLSFVPDVDIYPYEAVEPFEDDRPDADETESGDKQEAKGTDEKDNSVKYEVNRYASGAFTALSFVPEKSGIYVMKLRKVNAGWETGSDDVQCDVDFSIFLDADGNGLDDVWNDKYDIEDFADVLAVIQPFIISADKGLPVLKDRIVMWKYVAASADASGDVSEPISGKTEEIQYLKDVVSEDIAALNDAKLTSGNGLMTMDLSYDIHRSKYKPL
ncbi:MAG: hypothetical protein Q4E17_03420 [Synergistes sp.]|nr:hypothetical protein [Synergistes sp.]